MEAKPRVEVKDFLGISIASAIVSSLDFLEPGASTVPDTAESVVVVLRSFGKTYGLPGLRLGFAIAPKPVAAKLRAVLGPWPVSGAAITIGSAALTDAEWLAATRGRLHADRRALDKMLAAAGFASAGGSPLFRLVRHEDAQGWFERLAKAGVLVRRFEARPGSIDRLEPTLRRTIL
jgi:cobalamin biosynthetic protein CobC